MRAFLTLAVLFLFAQKLGAQELSFDRKYYNLKQAESAVFKLPFEMDSIVNVVYPEIIGQRRTLAPHYPDINNIERTEEARRQAFENWISVYSSEYDDYYTYIATYVRKNQSNQ